MDGGTPNGATIERIAEYFSVPVSSILGADKKPDLINDDEELTELLEHLKNRSEMRMLFQLTKNATKEDVLQAVRIIEALKK